MLAGKERHEHAFAWARCHAMRWSSVARFGIRLALCHAAFSLLAILASPPLGTVGPTQS
jgi:hypothetical protein